MPKVARYLITNADERTWKFDRPVIFLGEWCRQYDRRHIWHSMDAIVAPPYGLGQKQKDADHKQVLAIEEKLFPILCTLLNEQHGTNHDLKFWKMVVGHWFRRNIEVMLNRVKTLDYCLQHYNVSGLTVHVDDCYSLAPLTSYDAIWASNDDKWNGFLYVQLLAFLGSKSITIEVIPGDGEDRFVWIPLKQIHSRKARVLRWFYHQTIKMGRKLVRKDDAFIINSYLPKKEELILQCSLGQVPQLWASPVLKVKATGSEYLRLELANQIETIGAYKKNTLEGIVCSFLFKLLPVCYLEGYGELKEIVKNLPWPIKPRFIFTSNNFDADDIFKLWSAMKVESCARYIVGQHGNQYGTDRYRHPTIEETIADKFITWGWTDGLDQHAPAFVFKTVNQKGGIYDPNGGILLIELLLSQRVFTWDITTEYQSYFEDQLTFTASLQKSIKEKLLVRLPFGSTLVKWQDKERWQEFDCSIRLDSGRAKINELISSSRLVVHSYDSTGILETLSQNIPTIAFWQNNLDSLRESAKPYYKLLIDAGIVHLTPESAAAKVNEIWENVEGWWRQSKVQDARKQFCDRYARVSQYPVSELKKILSSHIL